MRLGEAVDDRFDLGEKSVDPALACEEVEPVRFRYGGEGREGFLWAGGLSWTCWGAESTGLAIARPEAAMALARPVGFEEGRFHGRLAGFF